MDKEQNTEPTGVVIQGIRFFNVKEIAKILGCTPATVRAYIKKGRLEARTISRTLLVTDSNLHSFLTETNN